MSTLREQIARLKGQEREAAARRANPELEASLEKFICDNPELRERYATMGSREVVRRMMLARMARTEIVANRNGVLEQWVKENPEVVEKVEQRINRLAADTRPRVGISPTRIEPVKQQKQGPRMGL